MKNTTNLDPRVYMFYFEINKIWTAKQILKNRFSVTDEARKNSTCYLARNIK